VGVGEVHISASHPVSLGVYLEQSLILIAFPHNPTKTYKNYYFIPYRIYTCIYPLDIQQQLLLSLTWLFFSFDFLTLLVSWWSLSSLYAIDVKSSLTPLPSLALVYFSIAPKEFA
jgi:hypothetical protein